MKNLTFLTAILIASLSFSQVPSYVPTDGLVGYWPFNGNANDESGNGNDGTVNGVVLSEDRNGSNNTCVNCAQHCYFKNYTQCRKVSVTDKLSM